jgi:hypothetical protein
VQPLAERASGPAAASSASVDWPCASATAIGELSSNESVKESSMITLQAVAGAAGSAS